jgi:hypothetical protein
MQLVSSYWAHLIEPIGGQNAIYPGESQMRNLILEEFLNDYLLQCGYIYFQKNQDVLDISNNMRRANYDLLENEFLFLFTYFNQLYKMY